MTDSTPEAETDLSQPERRRLVHRGLLTAAGALVPVLLVLFIWKGASAFLLLFAGYLAAVFFRSLAEAVARRTPLGYRPSLALVLLLLAGLLVVGGLSLAPRIDDQAGQLSQQIPQAVDTLLDELDDYSAVRWLETQLRSSEGDGGGSGLAQQVMSFFVSTFGAVSGFVVILFTGLYLAVSPALYKRGLVALAPPRHRRRLSEVLAETHDTLRHWLIGKVVAMLIIGVLTWAGLVALGIPLAAVLALLAAALTFIPNFGPVVSALPPLLLALAESPQKALWVALLYLGIQVVESYIVTPLIQKQAIEMPPALILVAQVVFSILFGFLGLLVATPLTAAALVLVRELYVKDVLEADGSGPAADQVVDEL